MQFFRKVGHGLGITFSFILRSILYFIVGSVVVSLLLVGATAVHVWAYARGDHHPPSDTIFVLGAAQYDGRPSAWFAARLDHAAQLYRNGVAPTIVTVGGGQPGDRFTEAESGKNYLMEHFGIPDSDIVQIGEGVDTLTSAEAFKRVADQHGWSSSVVVTDPAHSLRATTMVKDVGIDAAGSPTRQGPSVQGRDAQLNSIRHETGGLIYYKVVERERDNFRDFIQGVL
ncbi:YdcF family protein [Corynebacterium sp. 4HC-13]|uniref:YdcF family protein n=1 Tax=Corynebacterium anserum TaxID=2684406 RepID=A0A7G7YMQ8_9CORY|nr:YdcF family protein [Corynebacterium anserum]MBC2681154.1 YdcF family protein [Corynebacterium anserum]QNH95778.1 YdcF family protein [Corynebacterium anserum]